MVNFNRENIDGVLFDLGGTLTYINGGQALHSRFIYDTLNDLISPMPAVMPFEDHTRFLVGRYFDLRSEYFTDGSDFYLHEFMPNALKEYGIPDKVVESISFKMCGAVYKYEYENIRLFDGAVDLLTHLDAKGYKLGLISNTCYTSDQLRTLITKAGIGHFFNVVLTSCEERCSKPNAGIFLKALKILKLEPERSVYIGDNPEFDAKGASNAGMHFLTVTPEFTLNEIHRIFE